MEPVLSLLNDGSIPKPRWDLHCKMEVIGFRHQQTLAKQ